MEIARSLNWAEGATLVPKEPPKSDQSVSEDIWDDDDDGNSGSGSESLGMGNVVSILATATTDETRSTTIHGLALSNNIEALRSFIQENPNVDVNESDEFVCFLLLPLQLV